VLPPPVLIRARPGLVRWRSAVTDDEVVEVDGVPCTSPVRTGYDLVRTRDSRRRRRAALAGAAAVVLVGGAAVAIAQPGHDRRSQLVTDPSLTPSAGFPVCDPQDTALSLHWAETGEHGLLGTLTATNTNGATCTLLKRPTVFVTTADGNRAGQEERARGHED